MNTSTRRILLAIAGVVLLVCLCAFGAGVFGTGYFLTNRSIPEPIQATVVVVATQPPESKPSRTPQEIQPIDPTSEATMVQNTPSEPALEDTSTPIGSELSPEIALQMDSIQEQVLALRGLASSGPVDRALLTKEQLRQHVIENFLEEYSEEEAQVDATVLAAFGLLEPGFKLHNFYLDLYSEQIAGYYDDETEDMYVVQGEGFLGPERLTYAHEYTHALQDQNYDIENGLGYSESACEGESERCAAIQSLLEGDASSLELEWFTNHGTEQDMRDIQEFYNNFQSPVYDSAPAFLREDFIFPYISGQAFVDYLKARDGWKAVDLAYQDLPESTEQILHPERYPGEKPITVDIPELSSALGTGWREIDRDSIGEWYTFLILAHGNHPQARLDSTQAKEASDGWGGNTYAVYQNEQTGEVAIVFATQWDSEEDAAEFSSAFSEHTTARFGEPAENQPDRISWQDSNSYTELHVDGTKTFWLLGPNAEIVQALWENLN